MGLVWIVRKEQVKQESKITLPWQIFCPQYSTIPWKNIAQTKLNLWICTISIRVLHLPSRDFILFKIYLILHNHMTGYFKYIKSVDWSAVYWPELCMMHVLDRQGFLGWWEYWKTEFVSINLNLQYINLCRKSARKCQNISSTHVPNS